MKKSLIALAALAATGAFAQSTVTIYGRANVDVSTYSAVGATAGAGSDIINRARVADSGSRFGFRVNEDLGGGMRAFVVCETGMNIDNGGFPGQGVGLNSNGTTGASTSAIGAANQNGSTNTFCSREGHVGVGNATAELRLGRQNIWWTHGEINQTGSSFASLDILGGMYAPSSGLSAAPVSRTSNVALIHGGSGLGAFAGSQAYYVAAAEGATTAAASPNKGDAMGFKLNYSAGPIVAMLDYAKVNNSANDTANAGNFNATGMKIGAGYKYAAGSLVSFTYWDLERKYSLAASQAFANATSNVNLGSATRGNRSQTGWGINLQHALTNEIDLYAQYGMMGNAKNSAGTALTDTGVKGIYLGGRYKLSKRTHVHASYAQLTNQANNALNFSGGAYASGNANLGADPKVMAVGILHNF
jgi:predicted porin